MLSKAGRKLPILWISALLAMDVAAYLLEKIGCRNAGAMPGNYYVALLHQPAIWISILLSPLQLWAWTTILSRVELSLAYPLSGLNYPLTVLAAVLFLGESASWEVWTGTILITAGIAIIGPGGRRSEACPAVRAA